MDRLLEKLNEEQLSAVSHKSGPLLIVAGAGTGKTTVISSRIARLINEKICAPDEVLALTFTEKAASEMEDRVADFLGLGYFDLNIHTFHGFAEKVLRDYGLEIGLPTDFKILNEFEQYALLKKNLERLELDYYRPLGNPTKFLHSFISHFSRLRDEDISPEEYLKYAEEYKQNLDKMLSGTKKIQSAKCKVQNFGVPLRGTDNSEIGEQEVLRLNELANAYFVYDKILLESSRLDFGSLITYSLKLLRDRPAILELLRARFKHILVDEFQDTNWAQYELVKLLAAPGNNLAVVGDDDQAIYKWRGASLANILKFKSDYPESAEIFLNKNYRSRQNILDLAYGFIKLNDPNRLEAVLKKNGSELSKILVSQNDGAGLIKLVSFSDLTQEGESIAKKIAELKENSQDLSWNDFAILCRSNDSASFYTSYLDAAGIPNIFLSSRGLYLKPVVLDAMAYLKLLDNYHESPALFRVLKIPCFDFSPQEISHLTEWSRMKAWPLFKTLKNIISFQPDKGFLAKAEFLASLLEKHGQMAKNRSPRELLAAFMNDSGYLKEIVSRSEKERVEILSYLNHFLKRMKKFEENSPDRTLKLFMDELGLELDAGEEGALPFDPDSGPEAVRVMTVHGAKGLEFKYVFLPALVDKRFPSLERREPIDVPAALIKEALPEGDTHLEEERRLFYVALTRAKEGLFLSWARDCGGARAKKPSRFLVEAGLMEDPQEMSAVASVSDPIDIFRAAPKNEAAFRPKMPPYFSYTQLAAFKNCPYQYQFAHIIRVPVRGRFNLVFGQSLHNALQRLFMLLKERSELKQVGLFGAAPDDPSFPKIALAEWLSIYEASWQDDWYESDAQKKEYKEKGLKIAKDFFKKHSASWPQAISLEQGVNFRVAGYRIIGKIDRVDRLSDGSLQVVDYKTGTPKSQDKLDIDTKEQLLIYQLALQESMADRVSNLQFYYLDNQSEINFLGTADELIGMQDKILERIRAIEGAIRDNHFPPKPGPLCKFCDFREICEHRQ